MQEKSLIKKNILQLIDIKGISKADFYKKTGITRGVLDQNNGMSEENIARFLAVFSEINAEWLITGKGSMLRDQERVFDEALQRRNKVNEPEPNAYKNNSDKGVTMYVADTELIAAKDKTIAILEKDLEEARADKKLLRTLIESKLLSNQ